jgi:superfamily II DNA or RNA helicase
VPKVLRDQWYQELADFFTDYYVRVIRNKDELDELLRKADGYRIFIVSIDLAKKEKYGRYFEGLWDVLVVDEAHNLGSSSKKDAFVRGLEATYRIYLSATPHRGKRERYQSLVQHLGDVKNVEEAKRFVERRTKRLVNGIRREFGREPVFTKCRVAAVVVRATEEEKRFSGEITEFLASIISRRSRNDPIALLATLVRKRVSSSPRAAMITLGRILERIVPGTEKLGGEILEALASGSVEDLSGALEDADASEVDDVQEIIDRSFAAGLSEGELYRLQEFLDLVRRIEARDSKLEALKRILEYHVRRGEKVIVFTEYRDTLNYLGERLGEFNPVAVYGGLGEEEIKRRREQFEKSGSVLLATDVASEGLNLQFANIVVNYEPPWAPVKLEQRMGRVWRLRQRRDVTVYNLFLGTRADIEVVDKLYSKVLEIATALEDVKNIIGEEVERVVGGEIVRELPQLEVTENRLIEAQLRGRLDDKVRELEQQIRNLGRTLSSVYPSENEKNIVPLVIRLGLPLEEEVEKMISDRLREERLRKFIADAQGKAAVVLDEEPGYSYFGIARADFGDFSAEFPLYISEEKSGRTAKIGLGAYLELYRLQERAVIPDEAFVARTAEAMPGFIDAGKLEPDRFAVSGAVRDLLKAIDPEASLVNVGFEKCLTVIRLPREALETSRRYARETEQIGEDLVRKLEERKTLGLYDFYSYDPSETGIAGGSRESERYIEVKTHGRGGEWLNFTDEEFRFMKEKGKKCWLYTVWMLYGPIEPVILCFRDPLNSSYFKITEKEEEVDVKKRSILLGFDVPERCWLWISSCRWRCWEYTCSFLGYLLTSTTVIWSTETGKASRF